MKYNINQNNFIVYETLDEFIMIRSLFYDDVRLLFDSIFHYMSYLSVVNDAEFLGWYPGTYNPLVVRYVLDYTQSKNFNYRIFYDLMEVADVQSFERTILNSSVQKALSVDSEITLQSACQGDVGRVAAQDGFKKCCVFTPLKKNYNLIKTPIKYYEIDDRGFLIQEHLEKPINNKKYYQSTRLGPLFSSLIISVENEKLKYHGKK
jgi:hypothetical protein